MNRIEQRVAADHAAGPLQQDAQQLVLAAVQRDRPVAAGEFAPLEVQPPWSEASGARRPARCHHRSFGPAPGAPQHGPQARDQFARLEGLDQVVVGAELQAEHAIHKVAARGEHQHWHAGAQTEPLADLQAVAARQHQIEHRRVHPQAGGDFAQKRFAVGKPAHAHAKATQVAVVVDDGDARVAAHWMRIFVLTHANLSPPAHRQCARDSPLRTANGRRRARNGAESCVESNDRMKPAPSH